MAKPSYPITPAIRVLRDAGIAFEPRLYDYVDRGGTARSAAELGVDEHRVIKTLVMETETRAPLLVLMHGDCEVSTKGLARHLGVKAITPCKPEVATRHTGYLVGGTSPLGTRKRLPVYVEATVLELDRILINGGKRGFLVEIASTDLARVLDLRPIQVAITAR